MVRAEDKNSISHVLVLPDQQQLSSYKARAQCDEPLCW